MEIKIKMYEVRKYENIFFRFVETKFVYSILECVLNSLLFLAQISKLKTGLHHLQRPGAAPFPPIQRCPPNRPPLQAGLLLAPRPDLNGLRLPPACSPLPSPLSPWKPRSPVRLTLPRTQRVSVIVMTTEAERRLLSDQSV